MIRAILVCLGLIVPLTGQAAEPRVAIIAHRGASYDAPENTLAALRLAWEQQADGSEFDIYLTRDGQIAVIHDKDTKRTAGVLRKVVEHTLAELRTLDVGSWKGPQFRGEKIPTLSEMLALVPEGKSVFVEVKCGPEIVPEMLKVLEQHRLKPQQTPIISFNADVIAAVKKARPELPAYWLVSLNKKGEVPPTAEALIAKAKTLHADGLDLSAAEILDAEYARKIKAAGLKLYVWTVNDPKVARRMVQIGVEGITTDRPAWLREQLGK